MSTPTPPPDSAALAYAPERLYSTGCAIWAYKGWRGGLYPTGLPQRLYLKAYCARFSAVEGNTTFYAVPNADTLARWAEEMPPGFAFCPKLPRVLSHEGQLRPRVDEALRFVALMRRHLDGRLGPFLLQLPPSYGPEHLMDLGWFLQAWPRDEVPITVEVRHPDWFGDAMHERLDRMLARAGVGRAILDSRPVYDCPDDPQRESQRRKPQLPLRPTSTAPFVMVRYISHPVHARNVPYLERWADRIAAWILEGTHVYFFAHCPQEERSPEIARTMHRLLAARGDLPLPPLPWNHIPDEPAQADLF